jgi:hypothetical protein
MITVPTALILGAGASQPYGYPLGPALLAGMAGGNFDLLVDLLALHCNEAVIEDFQKGLVESGVGSIDAYLARVDRHDAVGRLALAHQMLHYDSSAKNFATNWLGYIWRLAIEDVTGPEKFKENKLSIVTFNYDTSVERFLIAAIQTTFDLTVSQAIGYASAIPIVHVYGSLPVQQSAHQFGPTPPSPAAVRAAAKGLIILHEGVDDSPEFEKARELLNAARFRAFLGFGYLKENVERLKVDTWLRVGTAPASGTTLGMSSGEVIRMQRMFPTSLPVKVLHADCLAGVREWVSYMTS